ncbi:MAG: hypothetical protein HQM13_02830 [SAR324 cluster bacterium]|nr:hypothetical protein [SAR324 cluster bacterium]
MIWISMLNKVLPRIYLPLIVTLILLMFFAAFYSEELSEDSYQHFQTSVEVWNNRDWKMLLTDTWNKPLPAILYGITGQWGIVPARWAGVVLTLLTGLLTFKLAILILSEEIKKHPWTFVGIFICQLAVLPQAFLTMTELFAAFLLACGLFLFLTKRYFAAFFVLGFLPLARLETSLILAWVFIFISLEQLQNQGWSKTKWIEVIQWNTVGSIPFLTWWGVGIHYTDSWRWFLDSSYSPYLRPFQISNLLKINFVTGLPGVLSAPGLFLFFLGIFHFPVVCRADSSNSRWIQKGLYGILLIHGLFLSSFVVYPKGSRFGDLAIGAINPRNYNVISPIIALFIFAGSIYLIKLMNQAFHTNWFRKWGISLGLTEIALITFFFFQQALGTSLKKGLFKLGIHYSILIIFCCWLAWYYFRPMRNPEKPARFNHSSIAFFLIFSFLFSVPLFWHPLRFYDQRALVQKELCSWLETHQKTPARRIIQDINSRLNLFCRLPSLNARWTWPHTFQENLKSSPAGSWIILETDDDYRPRSHYPDDLIRSLTNSSSFALIKKSKAIPFNARWEIWLNRISARNAPTRWIVYEKLERE